MTYIVLKAPLNVLTIIYRKLPKATTVAFGIYHWRGIAICRRCVYKILVAFAQRCVLHKAVYIISG